jgi:hypothetical protein
MLICCTPGVSLVSWRRFSRASQPAVGRVNATPTTSSDKSVFSGCRGQATQRVAQGGQMLGEPGPSRHGTVGGRARRLFAHLAVGQAENPRPHAGRAQRIVGDDQNGHSDLLKGAEDFEDLDRRCGVEIGSGFIGKNDGRSIDDGASDRQALLLAAGKRDRQGFFAVVQTHFGSAACARRCASFAG